MRLAAACRRCAGGAFLSGGIDSSTIAAMMRMRSNAAVRTYSSASGKRGSTRPRMRVVAAYLGTEHTELYVSPAEAREVVPELPTIYDEPFADLRKFRPIFCRNSRAST